MRTCTSQLCPERAGLSWEGSVGEQELAEEERSGEAGDGRGQPTADALNRTDGEG